MPERLDDYILNKALGRTMSDKKRETLGGYIEERRRTQEILLSNMLRVDDPVVGELPKVGIGETVDLLVSRNNHHLARKLQQQIDEKLRGAEKPTDPHLDW
jgi:hypothetical protein